MNTSIFTFMVGKRDTEYVQAFVDDLSSRLANRIQLTKDGIADGSCLLLGLM